MDHRKLQQYVPEPVTWLRAVIASIPAVGSALDHLLFDKADAIRLKNIDAAIAALSTQLSRVNQETIDKAWFSSEEALAVFRLLSDKVSYEQDKPKIDTLGRIVATCGIVPYSTDIMKLSVVEHLSRLSSTQIGILSAVAITAPRQKTFSMGALKQTATAIWINDIKTTMEYGPVFWVGTLDLLQELEILESYNTIRRMQLWEPSEVGYTLTSIGRHAASYVEAAAL